MNRRKLLSMCGQAAIGLVAAPLAGKSLGREFVIENPNTPRAHVVTGIAYPHPAIEANIEYWMKAAPEWLAECPPYHTSYYAVKEGKRLRVYAVKWNGANLHRRVVYIPRDERELILDAAKSIPSHLPIDQAIDGLEWRVCSYVYDHPLHRRKRWGASISTSLLAANNITSLRKGSFQST